MAESDGSTLLRPGQVIRPFIDATIASNLLEKLYHLKSSEVKELNSYDDKNFFVKADFVDDDKTEKTELWPHGYVLKVTNSLDSQNTALFEAQAAIMTHLNQKGFRCPALIRNCHGELHSLEELDADPSSQEWRENNEVASVRRHMVRLLTFVPGRILFEVDYTCQIFFEAGRYCGQICNTLQPLSASTFFPFLRARRHQWMLSSVPQIAQFSFALSEEWQRHLVGEIIDNFKTRVLPRQNHLETGVIHGDLNEQNLLVTQDSAGTWHISGVLDFGDIQVAPYLYEVSMLIAYMMIECREKEPFVAGGHVLAGYVTEKALPQHEFDLIKVCIAGRLAQSLTFGTYTNMQDPSNKYVLTTAAKGWPLLKRLWKTSETELYGLWRNVMEGYQALRAH